MRRLTPDTELRLHLAKAQEFWREDRLDLANEAMRNALRVGLPPGHWYDFQRMLEAELGAREHGERIAVSPTLAIETDPGLWAENWPRIESISATAIEDVARNMGIEWDRPILLTLFPEDSWPYV